MGSERVKKSLEVSLCFPCLNEARNIEKTICTWWAHFEKNAKNHEILVIDNNSSDPTRKIVARMARDLPQVRLHHNRTNVGYSGSCRAAHQLARGRHVLFVDGDGQYHAEDGLRALQAAQRGADLVLGVRVARADPLFRKFSAWLFRVIFNFMSGLNLKDPNVGLRVWKKNRPLDNYLKPGAPFANPQIVCAALDCKLKIVQIPVRHKIRLGGVSYYQLYRLPLIFARFAAFMVAWRLGFSRNR